MREGLRTSLFAVACVMAVSAGAYAAASVRSVGGGGTYTSAASAANANATTVATQSSSGTSAARAGSLRATGTYVKPTTTVSSGTGTTGGTTSRSAAGSRLSIGKYIGAPISISQQGGGGSNNDERIDAIERLIEQLENEKQVVLRDTDYITVTNDEVKLNVERLTEELSSVIRPGTDGHEVELDADNDDGIKWRYRARDGERPGEWQLLVSWEDIKSQMDLGDINSLIERVVESQITTLKQEIDSKLDTKVDKTQGRDNAGKVLTVDAEGHVTPGNIVYSQTEVDQFISNIGDDLDTKVDKAQGRDNAGKMLVVNEEGQVSLSDSSYSVDLSTKVDKKQGEENAGKVMVVTDEGFVKPSTEKLGKLAYKNQVGEPDIEDASITRAKAAEDIAGVLSWAEWWKENSPGDNAVLSVDANGNQQWFVVVDE